MHKEVFEYLLEQGYECTFNNDDESIIYRVTIEKKEIEFKIIFPKDFPNSYVEIYIDNESKKEILIPHIYTGNELCLYDKNESTPNSLLYKEEVESTLNRAIKLISESIKLENIKDYRKELLMYWEKDANITANIIFEPTDYPKVLYAYGTEKYYFITTEKDKLKEFIENSLCIDIKNDMKVKKVLYLPLNDVELILPPRNIGDVVNFIQDTKYKKAYYEYLKDNFQEPIILISQYINNEIVLLGFKQYEIKGIVNINRKTVEGILRCSPKKPISRIKINNYTRKRVFSRGGDGKELKEKNITILGCGSVGSILTKTLIDVGISKQMILIDNDKLESGNIGRHLCGMDKVGYCKVVAVKQEILSHYPDNNINDVYDNIDNILDSKIDILNESDWIFVAVGDVKLERKIINLFKNCNIVKPIVLLWVEPFLIAGHAIILNNKMDNDTLNYMFDKYNNFKISVIKEPWKYLKSESGCQSAYAPYSGFELQLFINSFVDCFNKNFIEKESKGNYIYTQVGRLKWARKNGIPVSDKWIAKDDRTRLFERINSYEIL